MDTSGRLSLGTTSPVSPAGHNSRLAVEGTDYHSATVSISANSANSNGAYLIFSLLLWYTSKSLPEPILRTALSANCKRLADLSKTTL